LADAVDRLPVVVVDVRKVDVVVDVRKVDAVVDVREVDVVFVNGAAAESERRVVRAEITRNFMMNDEWKIK
jgi:hypothetical protein